MKFFKAYKAVGVKIPTYFIESTAPNNVDDTDETSIEQLLRASNDSAQSGLPGSGQLASVDSDQAVEEIAQILARGTKPNLVVMVHGFNNPEPNVLKTYKSAAIAINGDHAIVERDGLVCVGYRWPSENMGAPAGSTRAALSTLQVWVFRCGVALLVLSVLLFCYLLSIHWRSSNAIECPGFGVAALTHCLEYGAVSFLPYLFGLFGWILAGLVLMAVLLRAIVYFRDNYRATNYGVPDLVQIIRAIDGQLEKHDKRDVELSFIGHSMGGIVVTNTIRTLSDVFATTVDELSQYGAAAPRPGKKIQTIGKAFVLKRFVLVSPDIPAETLLSDRGNFLASVLSRFDEAYLFSNEGDEVLRQISTLANYFVFPTKSSDHGFRLGNTEILSRGYGIIEYTEADFLAKLRIGNLTLQQLYERLEQAEASRRKVDRPTAKQTHLPKVFTYFDCTDYVDDDNGQTRGFLTFAKRNKSRDASAMLPWYAHLQLLRGYLRHPARPNVHGGYFEGTVSQKLIYRLACLGYEATRNSLLSEGGLGKICADKQIRVLLSPSLHKAGEGPAAAKVHGT